MEEEALDHGELSLEEDVDRRKADRTMIQSNTTMSQEYIHDLTSNEPWKCTKQPRIDLQIRKRKWGWLGHVLRRRIDDITRQALG